MMLVRTIQVGVVQTNCYVVGCEETHEAAVIDPGDNTSRILDTVKADTLVVRYIFNTHCHFDHMGANAEMVAATGAKLALHPAELPILRERGGAFWFGMEATESPLPAIELAHGQEISVGSLQFRVLHVPGHSPGSVAFYAAQEHAVFDGDVLFADGVGRTDLPGGDWETLKDSIERVLFALPDETRVYPGHGPATTIGREKRHNPWVGQQ
jgi:hydroxyacylglutathione hydrolase